MSADKFQIKRGTTSAVNAYLPALGEPVLDVDLKQLRIGDGVTLGGTVVGTPTSSYMASVLDDIDAPTARITLGAQTQSANLDSVSALSSVTNLTTLANLANVTNLTYLNTVTPAANAVPYGLTASTWGTFTITSQGRTLVGTSNQATARNAIAAAGSGVNSDITSLTGLTTALSVAQGGTGQTTLATAAASLAGAIVGTAFTNFTLQNSWVVVSGRRAAYRKFAGRVDVELNISGGTATDGTVIATLPAGFRPAFPILVPVASAPNTTPATGISVPRVLIGTDGTIACTNCSSSNIGFVVCINLE